jgi:hypothetical protein
MNTLDILAIFLFGLDLFITLICIKIYSKYIEESNIIWAFVINKYGLFTFSIFYIALAISILLFANYFFINYLKEYLIAIISVLTIVVLNNIYILIKIKSNIK